MRVNRVLDLAHQPFLRVAVGSRLRDPIMLCSIATPSPCWPPRSLQARASTAANALVSEAESEAAIEAITLENDRVIRSAPGVAAPVDPTVDDAGLRSLCRRLAYLGDQRCLQFTPVH